MGASDDIKSLEKEQIKIWNSIDKIKSEITDKIGEEFQKQTPEQIQSILNKTTQIEELYSKIITLLKETNSCNEKVKIYTETINNSMVNFNEITTKIKEKNDESNTLVDSIRDSKDIIEKVSSKATLIEEKLDHTISQIETKKQKLDEVEAICDEIEGLKEKIDLFYSNTDKYYKDINNLHLKIFGHIKKDDEGKDLKVAGLKDDLELSYSQLEQNLSQLKENIHESIKESTQECEDVKSLWENEHKLLKDKIIELLPGALTTGLSHAYKDKKDSEISSMNYSTKFFNRAIALLISVSSIPFVVAIYFISTGKGIEETILKLPSLTLSILPLYIPVLWVAYSSSKKINLSKRLIEEYAHKEALSKTFEGLSGQINNIKDSDNKDELKAKLLYNLLEVSAENPGKLIYDYRNADHPLMDALDKSVKLSETITKIANIPGMTKISNILLEKERKIKAEADEKVEEGLNIANDNK